jgi:hypothetical protein
MEVAAREEANERKLEARVQDLIKETPQGSLSKRVSAVCASLRQFGAPTLD